MALKVLDLFSGIGGFSLALDHIDHEGEKVFETVAFCEIDADARKVLQKHWPDVPIFTDVSKVQVGRSERHPCIYSEGEIYYGKVDVIVGGFPCQDISTAGKQRGFKDEERIAELMSGGLTREQAEEEAKTRSGLWSEYKRLIEEIRPRWVIIENVPNLLNLGFSTVLKDLDSIGYDASWEVISARSIGACHLRERIWIIAYPNGESVRDISERRRSEESFEAESGDNGENGSSEFANSYIRTGTKWNSPELIAISDPYHFRLFPSFATEEEKCEWWAEATFELRDWWKVEPSVRRVDDDVPDGLDTCADRNPSPQKRAEEKARQARIKQLGNAIVTGIVSIIGERIRYHEFDSVSGL